MPVLTLFSYTLHRTVFYDRYVFTVSGKDLDITPVISSQTETEILRETVEVETKSTPTTDPSSYSIITADKPTKDEENEILKELEELNLDDVDVTVSACLKLCFVQVHS